MRRYVITSTLALLVGVNAAQASNDDNRLGADAPRDQWLTREQISAKLVAQGYDVRRIKSDDGVYEVYAIAKDGRRIEAYVHPVTGEMLRNEYGRDDD